MTPRITVVVSTYRRPHLLPRLVEALECQDLPAEDFEVVIVDNASGDETGDVLQRLARTSSVRLRPLTMEVNRGPGPARNRGWRAATTPFVAFTDDDCVPDPRWLSTGLTSIAAHERVGVVQGATLKPVDHPPLSDWTLFREVTSPSLYFEACNLFFRRAALEEGGGFAEDIVFGGEDTAAGWSVISAGWDSAFEELAVVRHDLAERGFRFHLVMAWRCWVLVDLAKRYPRLRTDGFWRPWAHRQRSAFFALALVGVLGSVLTRRSLGLVLVLPWVWETRWRYFRPHPGRVVAGGAVKDLCLLAGMVRGSLRNRTIVL